MSKILICPINADPAPLEPLVKELQEEFPDVDIKAREIKRADWATITHTIFVFVGNRLGQGPDRI